MTLREEVVKYSGEELLSEEVLEEMTNWVVPIVQSGAKVLQLGARSLEPVAQAINWGAQHPIAGAAVLSLGTIASILIQRRMDAKRAVQTLKGVSEGDKEQLVKVADSNMSDTAKKSWIFKILGKYATKAKNSVNQVKNNIKRNIQAEKDYYQEKKNIKDFKAEQKQKKIDEKNEKRYIKRNFGGEEKYKEYQDWKAKKGL